jgi:hypothetical protein
MNTSEQLLSGESTGREEHWVGLMQYISLTHGQVPWPGLGVLNSVARDLPSAPCSEVVREDKRSRKQHSHRPSAPLRGMAASASSSAIAGGGSRRRPSQGSIVRSARSGHSGTTQVTPVSKSSGPVPLARRLLFPTWPADQPLPLLLGTDADDPLDEELYDFIALALRAFVHSWWSKLSRFDRDFLPRITTILRDVFRTLSSRAQATDLSALLCVDAPALLSQHVRDYRAAAAAQGTAYAAGGATPFAHLFHQRQAHMALGSDGTISEEYVRCAVDHILRVCLPPEDYTPETERFIVREIVIMIVVRSVVPKVTQPWFIHKIMLDQLGAAPSDEHAVRSSSLRWH